MDTTIAAIRTYVRKLIDENNQLRSQSSQHAEELGQLRDRVSSLEAQLAEQSEKEQVLRMAQSLGGEAADNSAAKRRINELVREIDKCIALLNK
ncbi:MAG: hypothetical protein ACPF83_06140 [Flavobacteriales bacterium]